MNAPAATAAPPRVMLLSLWRQPGAAWHARLVDSDARMREFDSPFELARYLAEREPGPAPQSAPDGLR